MTRLIAPILAFTSDEIWRRHEARPGVNAESVLFNDMPGDNAAFALDAAAGSAGRSWSASATR